MSSRQTGGSYIVVSSRIPTVVDPLDAVIACDKSQTFPDNLLLSLHNPDRHLDQTITFDFQTDRTGNSRD